MIGSKGSYALVTGASSGLGREYARMLARDGKDIVALARSRDRLQELARDLAKALGIRGGPGEGAAARSCAGWNTWSRVGEQVPVRKSST